MSNNGSHFTDATKVTQENEHPKRLVFRQLRETGRDGVDVTSEWQIIPDTSSDDWKSLIADG